MATTKPDTTHKSVDDQIAEYEAKIKELRQSQLAGFEAELETVAARASELRQLIASIKGTPVHPEIVRPGRKPKAEKVPGKLISAVRLAELVKEAGGELNLRKGGYDVESARQAIEASGGKFKMGTKPSKNGGKSAWPTVVAV